MSLADRGRACRFGRFPWRPRRRASRATTYSVRRWFAGRAASFGTRRSTMTASCCPCCFAGRSRDGAGNLTWAAPPGWSSGGFDTDAIVRVAGNFSARREWRRRGGRVAPLPCQLLFKEASIRRPLYHNKNLLMFHSAHQVGTAPITIVLHVNVPVWFGESQRAYYENVLRQKYDLRGVPIKFIVRSR